MTRTRMKKKKARETFSATQVGIQGLLNRCAVRQCLARDTAHLEGHGLPQDRILYHAAGACGRDRPRAKNKRQGPARLAARVTRDPIIGFSVKACGLRPKILSRAHASREQLGDALAGAIRAWPTHGSETRYSRLHSGGSMTRRLLSLLSLSLLGCGTAYWIVDASRAAFQVSMPGTKVPASIC